MEKDTLQCVGILPDGNRRWAKQMGKSTLSGHEEGMQNIKRCMEWFIARHIPHLIVYAFSTENWNRSADEVTGLMNMMAHALAGQLPFLLDKGIRVRFVGDRERLPEKMHSAMVAVEEKTKSGVSLTAWLCISYGGRAEILAAARGSRDEKELTEETFASHLWTAGMPDPDIIIRTGGRRRISNFLLWQAAYSELLFVDTLWPDFTEAQFDAALSDFKARERTFGV